ncbi:MAG: hypothetical protein C5B55_13060 [Blastocatellia bacterium]|nr:MAG: hypothetical protein C5B55_13060 [Blastocatellia bacterium]
MKVKLRCLSEVNTQRSKFQVRKFVTPFLLTSILIVAGLFVGCASGGSTTNENQVAATVNGQRVMMSEVERGVSQQTGGKQSELSQLQLAQMRLTVLGNLIQREVLFQRAQREKLLPTEDEIDNVINQQRTQGGMTAEDFAKTLKEQNLTPEGYREETRKDLAISKLQDKYAGKITISDREVEEYYNTNRQQFVNARGVALGMIMVDPADNSSTGIQDDAKTEADAKTKIDNIYTQLQGKTDFATVARAKSEDVASLRNGGDIGFATEQDLKNNNFPADLIASFFGPMQIGEYTQPKQFNGKWYIFKLEDKRLQSENLTLESQGVRQRIAQILTDQRKQLLNGALLEVAMNEAKVVNNLAVNMLSNPSNLGLRPAGPGVAPSQPAATQSSAATPQSSTPTPASSPSTAKPAGSPK